MTIYINCRVHLYFNPRPLAGATLVEKQWIRQQLISIHAPLRGRLDRYILSVCIQAISIHAPLRGRRENHESETA